MSEMLGKITFYQSNSFFVFDSCWTPKMFQIPNQQEKCQWHVDKYSHKARLLGLSYKSNFPLYVALQNMFQLIQHPWLVLSQINKFALKCTLQSKLIEITTKPVFLKIRNPRSQNISINPTTLMISKWPSKSTNLCSIV